jgi:hypothetical protein
MSLILAIDQGTQPCARYLRWRGLMEQASGVRVV